MPAALLAVTHLSRCKGEGTISMNIVKRSPLSHRSVTLLTALATVLVGAIMAAGAAYAGADATFNTALTRFTDFLEGSGGRIITVMSLAGGIVALASGRFTLGQVAIPVGVGVGAGTGVPIVTSTVTATI
jgi:conjugal transfer pilus assembly protein TraA